jgi:Ca-activated chloride channel homolog
VFSDGADRYSQATFGQVLARARRSQALIYPITIGKARVPAGVELATLTGGRSFLLRDVKELERTLTTIARELRYQYLIGYVPSVPPKPGVHEWRSIRVTLKNPANGLRVRARDGYTAE